MYSFQQSKSTTLGWPGVGNDNIDLNCAIQHGMIVMLDGHMLLICNRDMSGAAGKTDRLLAGVGGVSRTDCRFCGKKRVMLVGVNVDNSVPDAVLKERIGIDKKLPVETVRLSV